MSTLRQLSAIYLAAASAFSVAIVLDRHPDWARATHAIAHYTGETTVTAVVALNDRVIQPGYRLARIEGGHAYRSVLDAMNAPPRGPQPRLAAETEKGVTPKPVAPPVVRNVPARVARAKLEPVRIAKAPRPQPLPRAAAVPAPPLFAEPRARVTLDIAPPPAAPPPASGGPDAAEIARVAERLQDNLTSEMLANFDLFLYVSKAEKGPLAQRMYVFAKQASGDLALRYDWPVSTGREKVEYNAAGWKLPSFTPRGYYELDPHRMYRRYTSVQWKQKMPYAMFFNWVHDGDKTGLAIHAADGKDIALLGRRASGGCIHLAPENAAALFGLIRTQYRGAVPRFAYDRKTATMSNDGLLLHDAKGNLSYADGYRVLVFIEDYGGENVVATLM